MLLSLFPATAARRHLVAGRQQLLLAKQALLAGDTAKASAAFAQAEGEFISAAASGRSPIFRLFTPLPVLGRTPDAVVAIAQAGRDTAQAGSEIVDAIDAVPGGLGGLMPTGGAIPLERFAPLASAVHSASDLADTAMAELEGSASSLLLPPVADGRRAAIASLSHLSDSLDAASTIMDRLPAFLGEISPKRYLFAAQNPAEMRGTGGLIGVYSILTIDQGRFSFSKFLPNTSAPQPKLSEVKPPNPDYARLYDQFGGAASLQNANFTPDLPSAAVALENLWAANRGPKLDGVIFADPEALKAMLTATGPVTTPSLGITLSAGNVVSFVTNEVYSRFSSQNERKLALGEATSRVLESFLQGPGSASPEATLRALSASIGRGHIQLYANDPQLESAFKMTSIGGALAPAPGDFVGLVQNNGGGNKVDFYLDRSVDYAVTLGAEGTASGSLDVRLQNGAPLRGGPSIVLGPFPGVSRRGENVTFVSTYCSRYCSFTGKSAAGNDFDLGYEHELGLPFTWDYLRIQSGASATLHYETAVEDAWAGDQFGGTYRLTFFSQPTIRPTQVQLRITVPSGMQIASTSVPMQVSGSSAVWEGTPGRVFEVEVTFRPSPLKRAWLFIWHVLTMPVIKL